MKIALTGASGLVGSRIVELLDKDFTFISIPQNEMDITNKDAVGGKIKIPTLIFSCIWPDIPM